MNLIILNHWWPFTGVALISALTFSGVVPAHPAEAAVPEPTPSSATEMPIVPVVETLTATISGTTAVSKTLTARCNAPEGSNFEWLRDGVAISASANAPT